jgi:diguanylate cyclase
MIKKSQNFSLILLFLLIILISWIVIDFYRQDKIEEYRHKNFTTMASMANQKIDTLINEKTNATLAIALSLTKNSELEEALLHKTNIQPLLESFSDELNTYSDFKNVWIHIIDNHGISLSRSWDNKKNDDITAIRSDVREMLTSPTVMSSISVGKYDMTFKAMAPIYDKNFRFIGFVEVISHFNSIAEKFDYEGFKPIIIVDKRYTKQLQRPFSKIFLNGHYIANTNVDKTILAAMKHHGINYYIDPHKNYKVDIPSQQLIIRYSLFNDDKSLLATFLLFKPLSSIDTSYERHITIITYLIFSVLIIVLIFVLFFYIKQKENLQKVQTILDSQRAIVIVSNGEEIEEVNRAFLNFFGYRDLAEFLKNHHCVCDLFEPNDRFFHMGKIDVYTSWIDALSELPDSNRIVIMIDRNGDKHAFHSEIAFISTTFTVVSFTDITETMEENIQLQNKVFFDPLTKIHNRNFFETHINSFIRARNVQQKELALAIFDLDNFKVVNDTYGHNIGDDILQSLAKLVQTSLRAEDEIIRWGGEEFILLISVASLESATKVVENLRKTIERHTFDDVSHITCSFGITLFQQDEPILQTIARADKALYEAKSSGRNRVIRI